MKVLPGVMFIHEVHLTVTDVAAAGRFFTEVLELPVRLSDDEAELPVGRTRLRLSQGREFSGVHHLAFDVPASGFRRHREWLQARVPLLRSAEGVTEFEGPPGWDSRSVYFTGPDRMVLELIARHQRPRPTTTVPALVSISEVGIAVSDVPAAVATLGEKLGAEVFGTASEDFAPVGDHDGLLILVKTGRAWLPVFDEHAQALPLDVRLSADAAPVAGSGRVLQLTERAAVIFG